MLKTRFDSVIEASVYITLQKIRQEKGYLTRSEREQLKKLIEKPESFVKEPEVVRQLPIVTDIKELSKPCAPVEAGEDISRIITELKETLNTSGGLGLSANQIGYNKQIAYIKIMKGYNKETKKIEYNEIVLINPKILEHDRRIKVKGERCLSLPHVSVDTDRWVFITVQNCNEKLEPSVFCSQDMEAICIEHEIDHLNGKTILDRKHKAR